MRAFRAGVRIQFFVWRGSLIPPTDEELSPKCLVLQQPFDTFKSLLSLIFNKNPCTPWSQSCLHDTNKGCAFRRDKQTYERSK